MRRRAALITSVFLFLVPFLPAAAAQSTAGCEGAFPEAEWVPVPTTGVTLYASAVPEAQRERFASEIGTAAGWITEEMGPIEGTVCLVGSESAFDRDRFATPTLRFHAALDAENRVLAINTNQLGRVGAAAAYGLAHLRLWEESGDTGWPEPLASAIAHRYETRLLDRVELRHAQAKTANLFTVTSEIGWAQSTQDAVLVWDPASNESVIGDLVEHAIAAEGTTVLLDPDPANWAQREERWRTALRTELTGGEGPTTLWISGVVLVALLMASALIIAVAGIRSKRRRNRRRPTPPPLPGFFDSQDRAGSTADRR